jgi:hypothetical protein
MSERRMMRSCTIAACLGFAWAAPAGASDLSALLKEALANDPVYASARFAQQASSESEP